MGTAETTPSTHDQDSEVRPGAKSRAEALEYIRKIRVQDLGTEATKLTFVSGPDGVVMTDREKVEDTQLRRDHGGRTPDDKDHVLG